MRLILDRTVRRVEPDGAAGPSEPLAAYREAPACVLLGDPGAGKTTAFEEEARRDPEGTHFVSARDFLTFEPANRAEWRGRTLLIDGLDEVRAGLADARTPFDVVRARLDGLGKPRFRLSCREADWLGHNDRSHLKKVSPNGEIVVLRLDPLSEDEVRRLCVDWLAGSNPAVFFEKVADRGLAGLLGNPQNLELLARVFRESGDLPASRLETFERASTLLAREQNEEHETAGREVPVESVLDAAGRLCAVQLLSNSVGHCFSERHAAAGVVPIPAHGSDWRDNLLAALRTRLFAADGEHRFRPAHAHLAAYLAARHLSGLVAEIPRGRVLALLAGYDGAPPTSLRGLVAWLAALSPELRRPLIERDPAAVLMYGDTRGFQPGEKALLLDAIGRNPSRLHESYLPPTAVEGLTGREMGATLMARLANRDREPAQQGVAEIIVKALPFAPPGERSADALLAVVEDPTYWMRVRLAALDGWIRSVEGRPDRVDRLRRVLDSFREEPAGDPQRDLLGTLLEALYPDDLEPSEVWDYFDPPPGIIFNRFHGFWKNLATDCPDDDLPGHLDRLSDPARPVFADSGRTVLRELPLHLLARGLRAFGEQIEGSRLCRWLQVGMEAPGKLVPIDVEPTEQAREVRDWLRERPEVQKAMIRFALRTDEIRTMESVDHAVCEFLYRSPLPDDIGKWYLDEAIAAEDSHLLERHLRAFLTALSERPAAVDQMLAHARHGLGARAEAISFLERNLKSDLPEGYFEHRMFWWHLHSRRKAAKTQFVEAVRRHAEPLRANRAHPDLLYDLSTILRDPADWTTKDTVDRSKLTAALGGDRELVEAALAGITGAPEREDLPTVGRILDLMRESRMDSLEVPVLLGLSMRPAEDILQLDESRIRSALAYRLNLLSSGEDADWYRTCLRERPDLVAEVLTDFGRRALTDGDRHSLQDLYHFSRQEAYDPVAKRVTLPLLRSFPLRANASQLESLTALLQSALVHCDDSEVCTLIDERTALGSMTRRQRAIWFAAGIVIAPDEYGAKLREAAESEARAAVLGTFYETVTGHRVPRLDERLTPAALEILIREIGRSNGPLPRHTDSWGVGPSLSVEHFIERLSGNTEAEATEALGRLAVDVRLAPWRSQLEGALGAQRVVRRDARYEPPTPRAVLAVLDDGPPAGAGDLRELAMDRLGWIAGEMRTTNANLWRQFWNEDRERPEESKHENACRDALLALLRARLPEGCDAQPEGQYAGNRRADLRVSYGEWNVPVEIKKNRHSDLWRAVRNQLLPRYANDPATEGLGIYLVLWFGAWRTAVAENGRPGTPDALREHLLAELTPEERRRAAVVVMDVTPPHAAADDRRGTSPGSETGEPQEPPSPRAAPRHRPGLPNAPAAGRRRVG